MDQNQHRKPASDVWSREVDWSEKESWEGAEYFLTPRQRLQEVGEILATIALRSLNQQKELSEQNLREQVSCVEKKPMHENPTQKEDRRKLGNENETD
jgi:hypothetical protein